MNPFTRPSPRSRDSFRIGVSSLTALIGAASLTAVGWFAGTAAREQQAQQARDDAAQALAQARAQAKYEAAVARSKSAAYARRVVYRNRPSRTVVHTQYVSGASTPVTLGGGTVTSQPPSGPAPAAPQGPAAQPAPPPPPPPPPPAPTSGSHHG